MTQLMTPIDTGRLPPRPPVSIPGLAPVVVRLVGAAVEMNFTLSRELWQHINFYEAL